MDLVAGVRKEGSRGGRNEFKWSDVQSSAHRENYLGHSVMAPVGRWQKNRDLAWYAKGDEDEEERIRKEREELQRVKEAEEEAMAVALGLPVPPKASENANMVPLGGSSSTDIMSKEEEMPDAATREKDHRSSHRHRRERTRSPRRERRHDRGDDSTRDKDRRHRRHHDDRERHHRTHRHRSRSRGRDHYRRRSASRSRSRPSRKDEEHQKRRRMERSYSPAERGDTPNADETEMTMTAIELQTRDINCYISLALEEIDSNIG